MGSGISKQHGEAIASGTTTLERTSEKEEAKEEPMEDSKCPMHNSDGSYSYDWKLLFKAAGVHGPMGSKPLSKEEQEKARGGPRSVTQETSSSGCPVRHDSSAAPDTNDGEGCPVKHNPSSSSSEHPEYNVYSQPIDKTNQMPKGVKTQMPTPGQKAEISTERVKSTIPKGGSTEKEGTTWTYPSPQQFYNALARKGKLGNDATEDDMASVVALHNNMNEKTWAQVVEWERQTYKKSCTPKLLRFQGRPHDLSPKATLKHYLLGHPLPYDRHDWTVLRDDGSTVRYIIDYYYDESRAQETEASAKPSLHDKNATASLLVDVRPALDGPAQLVARAVQMPYKVWSKETSFEPLPLRGTSEMVKQVGESVQVWHSIQALRKQDSAPSNADRMVDATVISESEAVSIAKNFAMALKTCRMQQSKVDKCKSEEDCSKASMDLTMCMGPILCPVQHQSLIKALGEDSDARIEAALEILAECVVHRTEERQLAKEQHPKLFKN